MSRGEIPEDAVEIFQSDTATVWFGNGVHYADWCGKAKSVYHQRYQTAIISMPGLRQYHPDFTARSVFRPVLDRMLWQAGYIPLHAAALAHPSGCLLIGAAGAGKTTLLRGFLRRGGSFLGDDRALVVRRQRRMEIDAYPERIRYVGEENSPKQWCIPHGISVNRAPVQWIFFLERTAGPVLVESVGRAESVARLVHCISPYLGGDEVIMAAGRLEQLARSAAGYTVRGWGTPEERLKMVEAVLAAGER
jgi:hypothetical protein